MPISLATALWLSAAGARPCALAQPDDPLTIHLVSIAPGADLLNSMGHTVVVFSGGELGFPHAYNWGVFDTSQPGVVASFLQGRLEYFLLATHGQQMLDHYAREDRTMIAQRLALPPEQADAMFWRIDAQARSPELRTYAYHWADANCATKARDAIDQAAGGAVRAALDHRVDTTPRFEALRHFAPWPVLAFAWDFISSSRVDTPLTAWERTMVPEHLMLELEHVTVGWPDGGREPLVAETCTLHRGQRSWAAAAPRPGWASAPPGIGGAALLLAARLRGGPGAQRLVGALVALYGSVLGLLGTTSFLLWASSDLDGVGPTENWLVAGPQSWLLAWSGVQILRGRAIPTWARAGCVALAALGSSTLLLELTSLSGQTNGRVLGALLPGLVACAAAVGHPPVMRPERRGAVTV